MRKNKTLWTILFAATAVIFCYGVIELLIMRFETGDVYRPYSSYRSDPLGMKVFYEALSLQPGVEVSRNVEPLTKMQTSKEKALFIFGMDLGGLTAMNKDLAGALEDFVKGGGRLVIAIAPTKETVDSRTKKKKEDVPGKTVGSDEKGENKSRPAEDDPKMSDETEEEKETRTSLDLGKQWSFELELSPMQESPAVLGSEERDLPHQLPWRTTLSFKPDEAHWQALYTKAEKPVLMERTLGTGSIILSSNSYIFSNEAMKKDRHPRLLSYLCGQGHKIVFDETHLGVERQPGIAGLLRRYRLAPFIGSLVLLALLAIWRKSIAFVPVLEQESATAVAVDRDYAAGLTNLLRRNIGNGNIIDVCLTEWKRSFTHGRRDRSDRLPAIDAIVAAERKKPARRRNPLEVYRQISKAVRSNELGARRR